jgi:hypothetical protein
MIYGDRYYAAPEEELGLCAYCIEVAGEWQMYGQLFPIPSRELADKELHMCFVQFAMALAKGTGYDFQHMRAQYRYFTATDALTFKCLMLEAVNQWRAIYDLQTRNADAGTGEGVV